MRKLRHLGEMRLGVSPKKTIKDIHREKREITQTEGSQQAAALERSNERQSEKEREQRSIQRRERTVSKRERGGGTASGHQSER